MKQINQTLWFFINARHCVLASPSLVTFDGWSASVLFSGHCTCVVLQQSTLYLSLALSLSLLVCQKKWTAGTSPAARCDWFFSLSVSLQTALLPPHTSSYWYPVHQSMWPSDWVWKEVKIKRVRKQGNQYLKKTNKSGFPCLKLKNTSWQLDVGQLDTIERIYCMYKHI